MAQNEENTKDTLKHKNEVVINVVPVISEILVGDAEHKKYSFTYKRRINDNVLMNLKFHYIPDYSYNYDKYQFNYYEIERTNDTVVKVYSRNINSYCIGGSAGIEWEKEKERFYRYFGFNLGFSQNNFEYHFNSKTYINDNQSGDSISLSMDNKIQKIGLNLYYGWKIKLEDQFLLVVQFGPDIGYYFGDLVYVNENDELDKKQFSKFDLSKYFLNELAIGFRF
ncbi:MAG: hypothetical protein Kow0068_16260 [Marinilabiliales bacterium]